MEDKSDKNTIFVGKKEFFQYIKSMKFLLSRNDVNKIFIRARGRSISMAFYLAEAAKNKFLKELNLSIGEIKSSSEVKEEEGKERLVSSISIEVIKGN